MKHAGTVSLHCVFFFPPPCVDSPLSFQQGSHQPGAVQAEFVFGYSLPLHEAVKTLPSGQYELSLQFSPAIAGLVVREMDVKVSPKLCVCLCHILGRWASW